MRGYFLSKLNQRPATSGQIHISNVQPHAKVISGKTESMVDSAQIHIISPSMSNSPLRPRYLVSLIISFSTLFDFPHYLISRTAVLSELVIDWIIIGCVESCQREIGC